MAMGTNRFGAEDKGGKEHHRPICAADSGNRRGFVGGQAEYFNTQQQRGEGSRLGEQSDNNAGPGRSKIKLMSLIAPMPKKTIQAMRPLLKVKL